MDDVFSLSNSLKNIEKKRKELLSKNINGVDTSLKKFKSVERLKKQPAGNPMIKNLLRNNYSRSKLLEDALGHNFRYQKEEALKSKNKVKIDYKFSSPKQRKSEEKIKFSQYKKLSEKINPTIQNSTSLKYLHQSRNSKTAASVSTTNLSKNLSVNKLPVNYSRENLQLNQNSQTISRDYTSTINDYKATLNPPKRQAYSSLANRLKLGD